MNAISPTAIFAAFITILLTVLAFFFKREREFGTMQASLRALHKRVDILERIKNGEK